MSYSAADRRKAENEVIFRKHNERVKKGFDEIKRLAKEDDQEHLVPNSDDLALHFYCECSDENCHMRIALKSSEYNRIHKRRDRFMIIPGHDIRRIEKIVEEEPKYCVVEKSQVPRVPAGGLDNLNVTDLNNV